HRPRWRQSPRGRNVSGPRVRTPYARIVLVAMDEPSCLFARQAAAVVDISVVGPVTGRGGFRAGMGVAESAGMDDPDPTRLSGLDQSFLHFETPDAYMHVALTAIFDPGSLSAADGGIDFASIRSHIASRLHLIPRYRQRLHYTPVAN